MNLAPCAIMVPSQYQTCKRMSGKTHPSAAVVYDGQTQALRLGFQHV